MTDAFGDKLIQASVQSIKRENAESVLTHETDASVIAGLKKLYKRYPRCRTTMQDVTDYLSNKKKCIIENEARFINLEITQTVLKKFENDLKNCQSIEAVIKELRLKQFINPHRNFTITISILNELSQEQFHNDEDTNSVIKNELEAVELPLPFNMINRHIINLLRAKSLLTLPMIDTLIKTFKNKKFKYFELCFHAAQDKNAPPPIDMTTEQRLDEFFMAAHTRLATCKPNTVGIEALQGLHPDIPTMLDEAAVKMLLAHCYSEVMKEYLEEQIEVQQQLDVIYDWNKRAEEIMPIVDLPIQEILTPRIEKKFKEKGYPLTIIRKNNSIAHQFYANPLFLAKFHVYYVNEFEKITHFKNKSSEVASDLNEADDISDMSNRPWEAKDAQNFEQHLKNLDEILQPNLIKILLPKLQLLIKIPQDLQYLTINDYESIILAAKDHGVIWLTTDSKNLTPDAEKFFHQQVIHKLQELHQHLNKQMLEAKLIAAQEMGTLKTNSIFQFVSNLKVIDKENNKIIDQLVDTMTAQNEKTVYLLVKEYTRLSKKHADTAQLEQAILRFLHRHFLNLENCYGAGTFIKQYNLEKLYPALSFEDRVDIFKSEHEVAKKEPLYDTLYTILSFILTLISVLIILTLSLMVLISSTSLIWMFGVMIVGTLIATPVMLLIPTVILYNTIPYFQSFGLLTYKENPHAPSNNMKAAVQPVLNLAQSFMEIFHSYSTTDEMLRDLNTPVHGIVTMYTGFIGLAWAIAQAPDVGFRKAILNISYCLLQMITGAIELIVSPLAFIVKLPVRSLLTTIEGIINLIHPKDRNIESKIQVRLQQLNNHLETVDSGEKRPLLPSILDDKKLFRIATMLQHEVKSRSPIVVDDSKKQAVKGAWTGCKNSFFYSDTNNYKDSLKTYSNQITDLLASYTFT